MRTLPEQVQDQASEAVAPLVARLVDDALGQRETGLALQALAGAYRTYLALADLVGRAAVVARLSPSTRRYAAAHTAEIPHVVGVPFDQAIAAMLERLPVGIRGRLGERAALVAEVYSVRRVFALARETSARVAERVQVAIAEAMQAGLSEAALVAKVRSEARPYPRAYAQTVVRTNVAAAHTAGLFRELAEPDVRAALPAIELVTSRDVDVRRGRPEDHGENHLAADGLVARPDWPGWQRWTPPLGYNCRCALVLLDPGELKRRRLLADGVVVDPQDPSTRGARHHPEFGRGRPDLPWYGGVQRS